MAKWSSNQSVKLKLTTVGFLLHLHSCSVFSFFSLYHFLFLALDFFFFFLSFRNCSYIRFMTLSNLFVRHFIDLYLSFSLASVFFSFFFCSFLLCFSPTPFFFFFQPLTLHYTFYIVSPLDFAAVVVVV